MKKPVTATKPVTAKKPVTAEKPVTAKKSFTAKRPVDGEETGHGEEKATSPKRVKPPKPKPLGFGVEELAEVKKMERLHCSGRQVPSPMGGFLMDLGVRQELDGTSTILFECKTSALRYQLPLRISTWRERRKVRVQAEEGLDPLCPRGELGPPLVRRGKDFFCPRCNIMFGRVP